MFNFDNYHYQLRKQLGEHLINVRYKNYMSRQLINHI